MAERPISATFAAIADFAIAIGAAPIKGKLWRVKPKRACYQELLGIRCLVNCLTLVLHTGQQGSSVRSA